MLTFPAISALTLGATIILQMGLAFNTSRARFKLNQSLGDGGKHEVIALSRAHGNLAENASIVLITLALLESSGANSIGVALLAAVFFAGRVFHPFGIAIKKSPNAPRFLGSITTYMVGFISGGWLMITAAQLI